MKIKALFFVVLLLTIGTVFGFKNSSRLYIVINEADYCRFCKANGDRVRKVISEYSEGKEIIVIHNDVTNSETQKKMHTQFKTLGIFEYMERHEEAAIIYVFDARTHKPLDGFSIKTDNEGIKVHLKRALEKI